MIYFLATTYFLCIIDFNTFQIQRFMWSELSIFSDLKKRIKWFKWNLVDRFEFVFCVILFREYQKAEVIYFKILSSIVTITNATIAMIL